MYHTSQPPRAVLWDVDGTLLDSAELHFLAWRDTVAERGFDLTRERFAATFGHRNDAVLRDYFGPQITAAEIAQISTVKEARFRELLGSAGVVALPGVARWLARLRAGGWRQAVASSAQPASLEAMLGALRLAEYFAATVSARDVARGKPAPDVFLLAADRVGVPPERCVVVEDAPAGLEAARAAGMRAIGVRTTHHELIADVVVDTLDLLDDDCFERLLAE